MILSWIYILNIFVDKKNGFAQLAIFLLKFATPHWTKPAKDYFQAVICRPLALQKRGRLPCRAHWDRNPKYVSSNIQSYRKINNFCDSFYSKNLQFWEISNSESYMWPKRKGSHIFFLQNRSTFWYFLGIYPSVQGLQCTMVWINLELILTRVRKLKSDENKPENYFQNYDLANKMDNMKLWN